MACIIGHIILKKCVSQMFLFFCKRKTMNEWSALFEQSVTAKRMGRNVQNAAARIVAVKIKLATT